jgi:hypothetical protein
MLQLVHPKPCPFPPCAPVLPEARAYLVKGLKVAPERCDLYYWMGRLEAEGAAGAGGNSNAGAPLWRLAALLCTAGEPVPLKAGSQVFSGPEWVVRPASKVPYPGLPAAVVQGNTCRGAKCGTLRPRPSSNWDHDPLSVAGKFILSALAATGFPASVCACSWGKGVCVWGGGWGAGGGGAGRLKE